MADGASRDLHCEGPVAKKLAPDFSGEQPNGSNVGITGDQPANNHNGGTAVPEKSDQHDRPTATNGKGHSDCNASEPMDTSGEERDGEGPNDKMEGNTINTVGAGGGIDEMDTGAGGQGVSQVASAGGSAPVLTLDQGREKKRNDRYPIDDKGMLVVITNTVFAYEYKEGKMTTKDLQGKNRSDGVFGTSRARHKSAGDVNTTKPDIIHKLKRFFCHEGNDEFLVQKSLTPAADPGDDPIDDLISDLNGRVKKVGKRPKFLLFVLMSAGLKHGQFLLHSNNQNTCPCKDVHTLKSNCRGRRVADLVRKIQEAKGGIFSDIPKILLIQTISGRKQFESFDKAAGTPKPPPKVLDPDDFIPRGSDTFVYYVHTDYFTSCGFYMLELFCDAVDKLKGKITQCRGMLRDVDKEWGEGKAHRADGESLDQVLQRVSKALKAEQVVQDLELEVESLVEGWFDDMMTTVSARIDQHLKSKMTGNNTSQMRAHISSTLRKRVSMIDMLREKV